MDDQSPAFTIGIHNQDFAAALGRYWGEVGGAEFILASLYAITLGENPLDGTKSKAWASFQNIQSFALRMDILEETLKVSGISSGDELMEILSLAREVFRRRNFYAHGLFDTDETTGETYLTPFFSLESRKKDRQLITVEQVNSDLLVIRKLAGRFAKVSGATINKQGE